MNVVWRQACPSDYDDIIAVLDEWWGGRAMSAMLPRLFFDHFSGTSLVATDDEAILAFIVAFVSPDDPTVGYVHFVGVDPHQRGRGLGSQAYERVGVLLRDRGCTRLKAVTSSANVDSQAFHRARGFTVSDPIAGYDGPGEDRVVLTRSLVPVEH